MSYIIGEEYYGLNPENHRFTAKEWHGKYKFECFQIFGFKCSFCFEKTNLNEGVVHHRTYKHDGGIYQAKPLEIIDKISIACHTCHEHIHQTESIDGITKIVKVKRHRWNRYENCIDCNESDNPLNGDSRCESCFILHQNILNEYEPD